MKNEEKLLLGIGEISEDIIAEASTEYKRKFSQVFCSADLIRMTQAVTLHPKWMAV